jgi:cytochrome b
MTGQPAPAQPARVWDPLVRVAHWVLVIAIGFAWLTRHGGGEWHEYLGYLSLIVVAVRVLWGWRGPRRARFSDFLQEPRRTVEYAQQMLRGQEPRYVGHNPLGGWMIVALLGTVTLVAFSGWLYTTDRFWGVAWVEAVHRYATNVLLTLAALHVVGVLYASARHRENLIGAMLHGRKRTPDA